MDFMLRKKRRAALLLCACSLLGCIAGYLLFAQPDSPQLSVAGGFYDEPFYLEISSSRGAQIYYTLDGSTPDETAKQYTEPLLIENASLLPNTYSMRTDVTTGFYGDLIEQYDTIDKGLADYVQPDFLIDKCTVLRVVAIKNGNRSSVVTATYFVGLSPENYSGCNVLSIVTDPENLFDAETGIYVTGHTFEKYLEQGNMNRHWRFWDANYRQRGQEWERESAFSFFNEGGSCVCTKTVGIRIHGGVSRGTIPRSLNLYARREYDGQFRFGTDFFGDGYDPRQLTLYAGGNQLITQFPDYMMTERTADLAFSNTDFCPCVLFLNGEYWGFYWLGEKYDAEYFSHHYSVDRDDVIVIKNRTIEVGNEEDIALYTQLLDSVSTSDMSLQENYDSICAQIDIDSFLDYYATMIYIARSEDWPGGNVALWRTRSRGGTGYADGKWRWIMFDCNSTSMRDDLTLTEHDTLSYVLEKDPMFAALWKNASFRTAFRERIFWIADHCFAADDMDAFIDGYSAKMLPLLSQSWARFWGSENTKSENYEKMMDSYRAFFRERRSVVEAWPF